MGRRYRWGRTFPVIVILAGAVAQVSRAQPLTEPDDILTEDFLLGVGDSSTGPIYLGGEELVRENPDRGGQGRLSAIPCPFFDELFRQAVLIAARDELGATTRDFWLGESRPVDGTAHLELEWNERSRGPSGTTEMRILFQSQSGAIEQEEFRLILDMGNPLDVVNLPQWSSYSMLTVLEQASRDVIPIVLARKLGLRARRNKWYAKGQVPEEIHGLLNDPTFISQYLAVRKLHSLIRDDGESPRRLAALVWGYIHLGYLTECYFHPMHEVFKTRALLYAARLEAKQGEANEKPDHAEGIVAVAHALTGFRGYIGDRQDELPRPTNAEEVSPSWLLLGRPCYAFDLESLVELSKRPDLKAWAPHFYLSHLSYSGNEPETLKLQRVFVQQYPECYRIWLTPSYYWGVNEPMQGRWEQASLLGSTLYHRLDCLDGLPASVRPIVDEGLRYAGDSWTWSEYQTRAKLLEQLTAAADEVCKAREPREMSWQVLAGIIRELTFSQTMTRLKGVEDAGAPPSSNDLTIDATEPSLRKHPYWDLLAAYHSGAKGKEAKERLIADRNGLFSRFYRLTDFDFPLWCGLQNETLDVVWPPLQDRLWENNLMPHSRNKFYRNVRRALRRPLSDENNNTGLVNRVAVSPSNPWMVQYRVEHEWDSLDHPDQVDQWWDDYEAFPEVRSSIAIQYAKTGKNDEAIKRLSAVLDSSGRPDWSVCRAFGDAYLAEGNVERHIATIRQFLDHPGVRDPAEIAAAGFLTGCYLLCADHRKEAGLFLKRSAATPTDRGRYSLSILLEMQGRFDEAAQVLRDRIEGNPQAAVEWYWFCLRVQSEDLDSAADAVREGFRPFQPILGDDYLGIPGTMYNVWALASGEEDLEELARRFFKRDNDPYFQLHAFLTDLTVIQDDAGNSSLPLHHPHGEVKQASPDHSSLKALLRLFRSNTVNGKPNSVPDDEIDPLLERAQPEDVVNMLYFTGKYLALCGEEGRASAYWQRAIKIPALMKNNRNLAVCELRRRGMTDEEYRKLSGIGE